ncbi:hypothetical protein KTO58_23880 [Chitinophaga pendula]|uniref:hypothetical protein n=1 Tax=Chitinophaga TaxID=79328 RepID=UPI000BAFD138|nr:MULTISPECIES: hypothetical protein [Chitinophaga]ASZ10362.1 hypothetical protein CK934_04885 [Chitinophaga sp. MD30]UCJ06673.1 hypothetical protein KTO58_23880 [Chitinophaga pendula]
MVQNSSCQELLQHCRIRSARSKRRMVYEDWEKKLLRLDRTTTNLYTQIRQLGYEKLDPPYQRGWKRSFILRNDTALGRQATFYQGILDKINTIAYSHRKDFKVKKRIHRKRVYVNNEQHLRQPDLNTFVKLKLTEKEAALFERVTSYCSHYKKMITRVKKRNHELESSLAELNRYITDRHLRPHIYKLTCSRGYQYWFENRKYEKSPLLNRSLSDILNQHYYQNEENEQS